MRRLPRKAIISSLSLCPRAPVEFLLCSAAAASSPIETAPGLVRYEDDLLASI
jgi:hypothetical protein